MIDNISVSNNKYTKMVTNRILQYNVWMVVLAKEF